MGAALETAERLVTEGRDEPDTGRRARTVQSIRRALAGAEIFVLVR